MKTECFVRKKLCLSAAIMVLLILFLSACTDASGSFTQNQNKNLVDASGTEYTFLANEGLLYYLGDTEFKGSVKGEKKISSHLGLPYKTGLFSIKNSENDNILIRKLPDNEWYSIYRKTSLPLLDFSVDNCCRIELVSGIGSTVKDVVHTTCGDGISDKSEIKQFLSDIRSQKSPTQAGLYDLIKKPDGMLENCYVYAVIYGFFEDEPNLVVKMVVTSYNDLAYSVSFEEKSYVLPKKWLERLENV